MNPFSSTDLLERKASYQEKPWQVEYLLKESKLEMSCSLVMKSVNNQGIGRIKGYIHVYAIKFHLRDKNSVWAYHVTSRIGGINNYELDEALY